MASWTELLNSIFLVGKPITSSTGLALRDNAIAISEGASGAPRILDAALSTTVTTAGVSWVRLRTAEVAVGAVGSYAMLSHQSTSANNYYPGDNALGSNMRYASADGFLDISVTIPSGSWRCMGYAQTNDFGSIPSTSDRRATIWLRYL